MFKNDIMSLERKEYKPVLTSLFISLVFVGVMLVLGVYWETNDDPAIALLLSMENNNYSPFQWRLLSVILHFLYIYVPIVDWWAANSVIAVWLGAWASVYVIWRRYPMLQAIVVTVMSLFLIWLAAAQGMNFTRTAAAVAVGGCLLLADSIFKKRQNNPIEFSFGCLLLLYGASIRNQSALITLGFLAVIGVVLLLMDHFSWSADWLKEHKRQIIGLLLAAGIFFAAYGINSLVLTSEQREYLEYNSLRSAIEDYQEMYPSFEQASEGYKAAGLDKYDVDLLLNWLSEETDIMTVDAMEGMVSLRKWQWSLNGLKTSLKSNQTQLILAAILAIILALRKKNNWISVTVSFVFAAACSLFLAYSGRIPTRVLSALIIACMLSIVFLAGNEQVVTQKTQENVNKTKAKSTLQKATAMMLICGYLLGAASSFLIAGRSVVWNWQNLDRPWAIEDNSEERAQILDEINHDTEHVYIYDLYNGPASLSYAFSFWEPKQSKYCENYFCLGGWEARHPYKIALLEEWGITNPVRALFENPRVYSTYTDRLLNYLRVKYDARMTVSEVKSIGTASFVQYSVPIEDTRLLMENAEIELKEFRYSSRAGLDAWHLSARLTEPCDAADKVWYCNVTVNEVRYTFRLNQSDSILSAYFYGIGENFDVSKANVVIFELLPDGKYMQYKVN